MQYNGRCTKLCRRWDKPWDAHHVTFSTFQNLKLFSGELAPRWVLESVDVARKEGLFDLWAYVIMPQHVHLLIWPHEGVKMKTILHRVKRPVAGKAISHLEKHHPEFLSRLSTKDKDGRIEHHFWQVGGGYDRNLRSDCDCLEKLHYIHNNPVKEGLVNAEDDWIWSSARAWKYGVDEPIPIDRGSFPSVQT